MKAPRLHWRKSKLRLLRMLLFLSALVLGPRSAFAGSGGTDGGSVDDAGTSSDNDGGALDDAGTSSDAGVLACDGALCDTTNGASCSSAGKPVGVSLVVVAVAALAIGIGRRRISRGPSGREQSP